MKQTERLADAGSTPGGVTGNVKAVRIGSMPGRRSKIK